MPEDEIVKPQLSSAELDAYWMLFTANRSFKKKPRIITKASGAYFEDAEGLDVDHLAHTQLARNAFTRGMPESGAELAEELLELIALHDASNVAALILEPFSGSAGVVIPPQGYLQRLREMCTQHEILLAFDEVITGFGRPGAMFGAEAFGVVPHILNVAKQITNGAIPLGAVIVKEEVYQTFMAAGGPEYLLEVGKTDSTSAMEATRFSLLHRSSLKGRKIDRLIGAVGDAIRALD